MLRLCSILIFLLLFIDIAYSESGSGARAVYSKLSELRDVDLDDIENGEVPKWNSSTGKFEAGIAVQTGSIIAVITADDPDCWIQIKNACTITKVTMLADVSGSAVIDIWKDTYANYPPTVADTITASAKPTLSSAISSVDSTLTGWTTTVNAGDILWFHQDSMSTCSKITLILEKE